MSLAPSQAGPISIRAPVAVRIATGPYRIRIAGQPGPQGATGPQGDKGDQGEPGVTVLPADTPINGGFF